MTVKNKQMYDDFQLVYNNLASQLAPGLDTFEISMYLTKAYFSLVSTYIQQYEKDESSRKNLIELVTNANLTKYLFNNESSYKISDNSTFFKLPDNVLYIVFESVKMDNKPNIPSCIRNRSLKVIPVSHDNFAQVYDNPFQFNEYKALRLDVTSPEGDRLSEIVAKNPNIKEYYIRYVRKPKPIILETLTGDDKIEGLQSETECELNSILYKDIVRLAAQLAYTDYKAA